MVESAEAVYREKMGITLTFFVATFLSTVGSTLGGAIESCGDASWSLYKDEKCIKLINEPLNFAGAVDRCNEVIGSIEVNPMLAIKSEEEQKALVALIFGQLEVVDNVWLGAQRNGDVGDFSWADQSPLGFSNWAEGHPTDDVDMGCVEMTSRFSRQAKGFKAGKDGLWRETSCLKRNLAVCQKGQTWSLIQLQQALVQLRSDLEDKSQEISQLKQNHEALHVKTERLESNPVPLGFLYTEYPGEPNPSTIWPQVTWTEVTSTFAGLFFRAAGGGAEAFGSVQNDSTRQISQMQYEDFLTTNPNPVTQNISSTGWSEYGQSGVHHLEGDTHFEGLRFYTPDVEVRPRNMAVRIWKRTA